MGFNGYFKDFSWKLIENKVEKSLVDYGDNFILKDTMRYVFLLALLVFSTPAFAAGSILLEDMTWPEVQAAIKAGKTTVIVPTGGTEQTGPHIVLGKHNFILRITSFGIAQKLGDALVAPIMPYVPEGNIHPPAGHMRFAGTLSLRPETFAAFLEDTARSLKEHGFKTICFVGEHGASQSVQKQVAEKLSAEWKAEGVRVIHVSDYYDEHNGQVAWMKIRNPKEENIEAHGGFADSSEMLAAYPQGVRGKLLGHHTSADMDTMGVDGSSDHASQLAGIKLLDLKIEAAVKQIREAEKH
jgi:creatinine amidohydrolase/Fe(II)-dependent formamide hydrolase-like protein